ncbi:choline dehydrogenase, partial [Macrophomina phaseolina]
GASGLTVANRLTEDPSVTVLVLEAGPVDEDEEWMRVPFFVGNDPTPPAGSLSGHLQYDWNLGTEAQTYLDGKTRHYPLGRGVGGGTLINGMLWNRGNIGDYDDWAALIGDDGWNWQSMLQYFKRSETFTADYSAEQASQYQIHSDPAVHGSAAGGVQVSYQGHFYAGTEHFYNGLNELGVPTEGDPNAGATAGASFLPMSIDAENKTRADARRTHYDPHAARDNLYISSGQFVTRLKRSSKKNKRRDTQCKLRVGGVEFAANADAQRRVITAKREVILAAGAVHTPLILQHSGVGDSDFLASYDIETRLDLPGVGNNYQDHYMLASNNHFAANDDAPVAYATNTDANRNLFWDEHTGPWTAGPPNGVAFPSLKDMTDNFTAVLDWATSQTTGEHLLAGLDDTIVSGYERQKALLLAALNDSTRGQFEILNNNAGSFTYSLMKPLSRGQIRIRSADPFDTPVIDPRYGSNPIDLAYMMEAMRFNHRLVQTDALAALQPEENYPTAEQVADDARLLALIKGGLFTEYHPTGTASMLPLEDGGVVDANLRVYGTQNLRVIDSSIMPLIPAAHLQACVYGVAEKAADLIRES